VHTRCQAPMTHFVALVPGTDESFWVAFVHGMGTHRHETCKASRSTFVRVARSAARCENVLAWNSRRRAEVECMMNRKTGTHMKT
jgi:hypothetical protein